MAENDKFKLYTLVEVEKILGVSHRTMLTYVQKGKVKARKIGGRWKVSEESLRDYLNGSDGKLQ